MLRALIRDAAALPCRVWKDSKAFAIVAIVCSLGKSGFSAYAQLSGLHILSLKQLIIVSVVDCPTMIEAAPRDSVGAAGTGSTTSIATELVAVMPVAVVQAS